MNQKWLTFLFVLTLAFITSQSFAAEAQKDDASMPPMPTGSVPVPPDMPKMPDMPAFDPSQFAAMPPMMLPPAPPSVQTFADGSFLVLAGDKITKYDSQMNVVKSISLPRDSMQMGQIPAPPAPPAQPKKKS